MTDIAFKHNKYISYKILISYYFTHRNSLMIGYTPFYFLFVIRSCLSLIISLSHNSELFYHVDVLQLIFSHSTTVDINVCVVKLQLKDLSLLV